MKVDFTESMVRLRTIGKLTHSFIAPIKILPFTESLIGYGKRPTCHLLLAHLLKHKKYCDFYKDRHNEGDMIILDNGAFEFKKPIPIEEYSKYIDNLGFQPDVVVAPDYPFEPSLRTLKETELFIKQFDKYFDSEKTKIMAVPQSTVGDWEDWLRCYRELLNNDRVSAIGMSILGVPNAFCSVTGTKDITFNRNYMTSLIKRLGIVDKSKWYHYLGCGSPREIIDMVMHGVADSNDSSSAVWHAVNGITFDESATGLVNGKTPIEVDFLRGFDNLDKDEEWSLVRRISNNMYVVQKWIDDTHATIIKANGGQASLNF